MTEKQIQRASRSAFTFAESLVGVLLASVVLLMTYKLMSSTRENYQHGTVNLQNLQEARMAVNWLRRDFISAVPFIDADNASFASLQRARSCVFETSEWPETEGVKLIQLFSSGDSSGLSIPRLIFDSSSPVPEIETVTYTHDPMSMTLLRRVVDANGSQIAENKFTGIAKVTFRFYVHQLNPGVPLLWVNLLVHEGLNDAREYGTPLALTTTISSPFVTSLANNRGWRYETGHALREF